MRAVLSWSDNGRENDGLQSPCCDIAFRPDGTQLIAAVGARVLVYDAAEGTLLHSLKGHKDTVKCVAYSRDGKRFASGGADKAVIIWNYKFEGILKFNHNDAVECLAYNPVTQQLASGTANDFGIWSPEQKSVSKRKASSKVLSVSWSADGQFLALGMQNGVVCICDKNGQDKVKIEKNAPVRAVQWNVTPNKTSDMLAVGCRDGTLSFYNTAAKQIGKDENLGFDPCTLCFYDTKYLCIGGSNKQVVFYTKDGVKLVSLCETKDQICVVRPRPKHDYIVLGSSDGNISMIQILFLKIHGLHLERYAFRDSLTEAVVHNLISNEKIRIFCNEYISKIAIYQKRVAVQLSSRVVVYELHENQSSKGGYHVCAEFSGTIEYNLLILTSQHVLLCQDTCLQLLDFFGERSREWHLSSPIRYVKVCGGPCGGEGLLVGLKDGSVVRIWINNPFPACIYSHTSGIRCLDLSSGQTQLAAVDEGGNLFVYDLKKKQIVFEEKCANSVAWNTEKEEMLCYAGNGTLSIKVAGFPVHHQNFQGYVVGFQGSRLFCLHEYAMQTIDVPLSWSMKQYVQNGDYENAYSVACLGITQADWKYLGLESLKAQCWNIAHGCFSRLQDVCYLDVINKFSKCSLSKETLPLLATVYAYQVSPWFCYC
uniref:Intraflagellar transport protein 122 homolog n=1 Tax=Marsilea vestita TaxID=59764 RepID=I6XTJ0_MARVE|nr:intraflagellar transport protein 122-like protein [Marsilea vestita]